MALLGNGFRDISRFPGRYVGAFSGVASPSNLRTMFGRGDRMAQSSHFGDLAGTPDGAEHPTAWILPMQGGAMVAGSIRFVNKKSWFLRLGSTYCYAGKANFNGVRAEKPDGEVLVAGKKVSASMLLFSLEGGLRIR